MADAVELLQREALKAQKMLRDHGLPADEPLGLEAHGLQVRVRKDKRGQAFVAFYSLDNGKQLSSWARMPR